jgi:hypothetical protein
MPLLLLYLSPTFSPRLLLTFSLTFWLPLLPLLPGAPAETLNTNTRR